MNKFEQTIGATNKEIKGKRAALIAADVASAQTKLVQLLEDEKRVLTRRLMDLEDLSPDSALSLNPTKVGFDAKKWVNEMQTVKIQLIENAVMLKCAEETMAEYFVDDKA